MYLSRMGEKKSDLAIISKRQDAWKLILGNQTLSTARQFAESFEDYRLRRESISNVVKKILSKPQQRSFYF